MTAIFYDLETTDLHPIGQILNYCFIEVDKDFKPVNTKAGKVELSRTQLPSAGAILANRSCVADHTQGKYPSEAQAMREIADFFEQVIKRARGRVPLIGYNSARFDLPYLRTSLMRNGISPYFGGKLGAKDLFHVVQKLSVSDSSFPRIASEKKANKLSLKLETLTKAFGVLSGEQTHESKDDVLITISLARELFKRHKIDIRIYEAYEAGKYHKHKKQAFVLSALYPNRNLEQEGLYNEIPMTLLDVDKSSALWVNLDQFKEGQGAKSVSWFGRNSSFFFVGQVLEDEKLTELSSKAIAELKNVNLVNYFPQSKCDIEQDIYRLHNNMNFAPLEALEKAIWQDDTSALKKIKDRYAKVLYRRYELINYKWGAGQDPRINKILKDYALYRYGGKLPLSKNVSVEDFKEGVYSRDFHPTFNELKADIDAKLEEANKADKKLLSSLRDYYFSSDIYQAAGKELEAITRRKSD